MSSAMRNQAKLVSAAAAALAFTVFGYVMTATKEGVLAVAILGMLCAALSAGPAKASDQTFTFSIGTPITLNGGVFLTVPFTFTCSPATEHDPSDFQFASADIVVLQKHGNDQLASGFGSFQFGLELCDNNPHPFVVDVFPFEDGPLFHGGRAVASAGAIVCFFDSTGQHCNQGSSLEVTRIRGGGGSE